MDEGPLEAHRRVIETNLLGCLYGPRIAIRLFRQQVRGVLVNVASAAAYVGQPFMSAYVASKFGIRGLSECIRQEVSDCPEIHVRTVLPVRPIRRSFSIPGTTSAAPCNRLSRSQMHGGVAELIVATVKRPRRESFVDIARALPVAKALAPGRIESYVGNLMKKHQMLDQPAVPSSGNSFELMIEGDDVSGGWRDEK